MTMYYVPDITGTNSDYEQVNLPVYVRKTGIQIVFEQSPVFVSSLKLALTDGSGTLLVKNVDWNVTDSDIDETAMSRAFLEDPGFTGTLVKSVTIISSLAVGKRLAVSYQQFYLTQPNRTFDNGVPIEITPDLIKDLVTGQADMRQQIARVASPVAPVDPTPDLLPFDINCELNGNVITDETIVVNTVSGAKVIRLSHGAYFANTLNLVHNGAPLSRETDYLPISLSRALTEQSTNPGGVYQYILLIKTITGPVKATYHAVGGDVQLKDVNALHDQMLAITTFLNDSIFITTDTITETPSFRAFNARLNSLETNMRSLLTGTPTYGDSTAGAFVRRPVAAADANFHWWTIASLFKVQGSSDIITADQFKGRVFFPGSKVALSFTVDVNLNQARNPVSFQTENLVFDPMYVLFSDYSAAAPVYPMLRVVWGQASQSFSGACLQIGLPLIALSDQMVVEDLSTTESCWILDKTGQFITGSSTVTPQAPLDNNFVLPSGMIWSAGGSSSKSKVCVPHYAPGYLVYQGTNVALSALVGSTITENLFSIALPTYFPTTNVSSIIVTLSSTDSSVIYDVEIPLPLIQTGYRSGRSTTFVNSTNSLLGLTAKLSQSTTGVIKLNLNVKDLTVSQNAVMTDVIRYVRAKV